MELAKRICAALLIVLVFIMVANPGLAIYIGFKAVELVIAWALINGLCKLITGKSIQDLFS